MFAKAVIDFDEIKACAYSGSELYGGLAKLGRKAAVGSNSPLRV